MPEQTDFGFQKVDARDKKRLVRRVFDSVADRYDLMNDLMSAGVHRAWKGAMIDWLAPRSGRRLVDVAGGTGDITLRFLDRAARTGRPDATPATAIICDINAEMLLAGRPRAAESPYGDQISHAVGDAENLPLPDASADVYTIAFGIRNVTDIDAALREARRVLKPGGRFMCLEFSHPTTDLQQKIYDLYSFNVIPRLGGMVTGDRDAYQYLVESIRRFPNQDAFAKKIGDAGLTRVQYRNMTGGVAALHSAWRV